MSESCIAFPYIDNKPSKLYKDMLEHTDREFTNYVYARYLTSGVAADMDAAGYKRDSLGQHNYKDVYEFLDGKEIRLEQNRNVVTDGVELGTRTTFGDFVNFENAEDAYSKAIYYNSKHLGRVAFVVQHGEFYNVIIEDINVSNQSKRAEVESQMKGWEYLKQELANKNIDLSELAKVSGGALNPLNISHFFDTLDLYSRASLSTLGINDIKIYLTLNKHLPKVQALMNRGWGTLDEIAQKCYDIINGTEATTTLKNFVLDTISIAKSSFPIDIKEIKQSIKKIYEDYLNEDPNKYNALDETIKQLNDNFDIYTHNIDASAKKLKTFRDVVARSIVNLERQIRKLESRSGLTDAVIELDEMKSVLINELQQQQYYHGLLNYLSKANEHTKRIKHIIKKAEEANYTTKLEKIRNISDALVKVRNLRDSYYDVITILTNASSLALHENISKNDIENLQNLASQIKTDFDVLFGDSNMNKENTISRLEQQCVLDLLVEYLGEDVVARMDGAKITEFLTKDNGITDMLYSMGKNSNDILAMAGTIIRDAQTARDADLTTMSYRIRKITKELYDSGSNSEFIYDSKGRIITINDKNKCIDWDAYYKAKSKFKHSLFSQNINGIDAKIALDAWEKENTEEQIVDHKTGRTERIPIDKYTFKEEDNPFNKWTDAQKKYYKEALAIKGELGSLLPHYAQKQYLAPQLRKEWLDVAGDMIKGKVSLAKGSKILLDKIKHFVKVSNDESEYASNVTFTNYDDTIQKEVPVFYMAPVELGNEDLLKDFSSALQSFASTALNFNAMNEIESTIETIRGVAESLVVVKTQDESPKFDTVTIGSKFKGFWSKTKDLSVKIITKKSKETKVYEMLNSYIDYHLYNQKMKGGKKLNKFVNSFIKTNSILRLSANVTGAAMNVVAGDIQMIIESTGGRYYNPIDLIKAHTRLFGKGVKSPGVMLDVINGTKSNFDVLLCEYFDAYNEEFESKSNERYYKSPIRRLYGKINPMMMYSGGEAMIRSVNMYAMLYHEKVKINGKKTSLINAFKKSDTENGFAKLELVDNVTDLNGNPITLDGEYLKKFKKKIKGVAEDCFGSMNVEDKGLINQHFMGRLAMNFRQWMVGHYSRRFRTQHWDYQKEEYVRGYYVEAFNMLRHMLKGYSNYKLEYEALSPQMKEEVKASYRKVFFEHLLLAALFCGNMFGGDVDDDDDALDRWLILLMKRSLSEVSAATPIGLIPSGWQILDSPIPATSTMKGFLYPITGLFEDLYGYNSETGKLELETYKTGRHKNKSKYWTKLKYSLFPPYKQIDYLMHIEEENNLFTPYR